MTPPAASAAGRTLPRPVAPRAPRRVSGPAARRTRTRPPQDARRAPRAAARDPFILRALHRTQQLSDSRFLDRLIRGRLWIPLVAAGLMGIVFMQVSMLKLNAGIGRAVQSAGTLDRQNATLRADVSRMESGSKIDEVAKSLGMVEPSTAASPNYVSASARGLAAAAAHRMTPADANAILRAKEATALANGQSVGSVTGAAAGTTGLAATTTGAGTATTAAGTTGTATTAATTTPQAPVTTPQTTGAATTGATVPPQSTGAATSTGTGATATTGTTGTTGATTTGAVAATPPPSSTPVSTSGGAVAPAAG
jgi:hypothetical protein